MNDWQPIETAPKDQEIMIFDASDGSVSNIWLAVWHKRLGQWVTKGNPDLMENPILWMPLPKKPNGYD